MSGLAALLAGREQPGVHRWVSALDVAEVAAVVDAAGWVFAHVDGWTTGTSKSDFLSAVGAALAFPAYYGHNLDALADCLRDVGIGGPGVVLLWDGWGTLARSDRRTFDVVVDLFAERVTNAPVPFTVLLRGEGPDDTGISLLD